MLIQRFAGVRFDASYARAKMRIGKSWNKPSFAPRRHAVLGEFEIGSDRCRYAFGCSDTGPEDLHEDALLWGCVGSGEAKHWMVWDAQNRLILDPKVAHIFPRDITRYVRVWCR